MASSASIEVEGLTKMYGEFRALNSIAFSVLPGEIVGFLGPNGAGKTTTMKILTCFMAATDGDARVAGFDVRESPDDVRRHIGYLPENVPLYDQMLVYDYLNFVAEVRGVPSDKRHAAIKRTAEMTGLQPVIARAISECSKGYRQRVGLAQAIIHEPDVVILDEPTTGLDPNQIVEIRDVIKTIGAEKTVLFSTHIMQEVAAVCDRVIIINHGELMADDTVDALKAEVAERRPGLQLVVRPGKKTDETIVRTLESLTSVRAAHIERRGGDILALNLRGDASMKREVYRLASDGKLDVQSLGAFDPSLEDVFRAFTGGDTEEGPGGRTSSPKATTEEE